MLRAFDDEPIVYIWADGVHAAFEAKRQALRPCNCWRDSPWRERFWAIIQDGVREVHAELALEVLLSLKGRGMNAPKLAIGDGAMGFWAAMDEVYPTTRHQRCCNTKR